MKKSLYYFFGLIVLLSSCKKDDDYVFDKSPDERINESLTKYQTILTGAKNGWKGYIRTSKNKTYSFYFKFDNANRVKILSDFTATGAGVIQDAGYRLKQQQQPTLLFDTYSYVHVLADPNEANAGVFADINTNRTDISNTWYYVDNDLYGPDLSAGLYSDFEFIIDESLFFTDSLQMIGKIMGSKLTLIKATADEEAAFTSGQWTADLPAYISREFLTYYDRLKIGTDSFDIRSHHPDSITFNWADANNAAQKKTVGFKTLLLNNGLTHAVVLQEPVTTGTITFDSIIISSWDSVQRTLNVKINGISSTIKETVLPIKLDLTAASRWIAYARTDDGYWVTYDGFYVNGKRDAYSNNKDGIENGFYSLAYFPANYLGSTYNVLGPLFLTPENELTLDYLAEISFTTTGGISKFRFRNNYGYPQTGNPGLTLNQLLLVEGYYFVKIDDKNYDMVSAKDGKAWLSWIYPF